MSRSRRVRASSASAARSVAAPARSPDGWHILLRFGLPIALVCAALIYAPALNMFFAQDDVTFIARARGLERTPWSMARPLSEGLVWRMLYAMFGLHPFPYHAFNFVLHLINVALVYAIGTRLLKSRGAGLASAILFGVSSIAFTPLHWASCLVELLATTFSLAAFHLWLVGRERNATGTLWIAALLGFAALVCKESAIFLPLVLLVTHWRLEPTRPAGRTLAPQITMTLAYALAFILTLRFVHYVGSEAYAMSPSPVFIALNLGTYLRWIALPHVPVRDAVAAMDPAAWPVGLAVAVAALVGLALLRNAPRHPEEVGAAWFLAMLLPVVPLEHHSYLYYLYLAWPGACWMVSGFGQRAVARGGQVGRWAAVALLMGYVAVSFAGVRAREHQSLGTLPLDKTMRESLLLKNVVTDLREAKLQAGDRIAFVNPAPRVHFSVAGQAIIDTAQVHSYLPIEGALRNGEVIRVFFPGVQYLGFGSAIPPAWEDAKAFLYQDEGTLRQLGRGTRALAELGYFSLRLQQWKEAEAMFLRSRALGDTLADATFGLIITSSSLGREPDARRYAEEFLRRWPRDERAATVAAGLRQS